MAEKREWPRKCIWSVDGVCQTFVFRGTTDHPNCDGQRKRPCASGLDLIDIRDLKHPGRGGRRAGAGAPRGNLNAIKSGSYSKQLQDALLRQQGIIAQARAARARRSERR